MAPGGCGILIITVMIVRGICFTLGANCTVLGGDVVVLAVC